MKKKDNEGTKWLKDMRQWWRKSGRELQMPVDGLSGATRAPGEHQLSFADGKSPLDKLPPATTSWSSRPRAKSAAARSCACRSSGRRRPRRPPRPRASTNWAP